MKVLSLNCRGLGILEAVTELCCLAAEEAPQICFFVRLNLTNLTKVWAVMIPPKIKKFIWRACIDSLPFRTKLFDRKILNTFSCVLCLEAAESFTHLLCECFFAQAA